MKELETYLNEKITLVDKYIKNIIPMSISKTLYDASIYSLEAGGKRLRPILSMLVYEMLININCMKKGTSKNDLNLDKILPLSAALELIHTYSLIHDDLPAMDNDDLRRGIPTNHKVFGEAMSILAGDALLSESFSLLCNLSENFDSNRVLKVIKYLATSSGINGMVGGQALDIENVSFSKVDLDYLTNVNKAKTGALIKASVVAPAILIGSEEDISILSLFGEKVGFAFQLIDDVLGTTSTKQELGKTPDIDAKNDKVTFAQLLGIDKTKNLANQEIMKAKEILLAYDGFSQRLSQISDFVINRSR